jgi:hypothetical protein
MVMWLYQLPMVIGALLMLGQLWKFYTMKSTRRPSGVEGTLWVLLVLSVVPVINWLVLVFMALARYAPIGSK